MTMKERIGLRIMKRRQALKMPACELARMSGVHRNTISRMEAGEGGSIESVWRISRVLEVTIEWLMEDAKRPSKEIQLNLWPKQKVRNNGFERLRSIQTGRSDGLPVVSSGLGYQRSGASQMPSREAVYGLRDRAS